MFKLDYSFGFSLKGFIIVLLPMIPNIFYFIFPKVFISDNEGINHKVLEKIEHGSQILFIGILLMIIPNRDAIMENKFILIMAIFLLSYYFLWGLLFLKNNNSKILICMAIFPVIYFIISEIWISNYMAIIPTLIYGITHTTITYLGFSSSR